MSKVYNSKKTQPLYKLINSVTGKTERYMTELELQDWLGDKKTDWLLSPAAFDQQGTFPSIEDLIGKQYKLFYIPEPTPAEIALYLRGKDV